MKDLTSCLELVMNRKRIGKAKSMLSRKRPSTLKTKWVRLRLGTILNSMPSKRIPKLCELRLKWRLP